MSDIAVSSERLRRPLEHAMDARCENLTQQTYVWDPDPEVNSLAEIPAVLMRLGVDPAVISTLAMLVRKIAESNMREGQHELDIAGTLDSITAGLHYHGMRSTLTVKAAARKLRPALSTLARGGDATRFFAASCDIKDVLACLPPEIVQGRGLRHELGDGRHDLLLSLIPADAGERAA